MVSGEKGGFDGQAAANPQSLERGKGASIAADAAGMPRGVVGARHWLRLPRTEIEGVDFIFLFWVLQQYLNNSILWVQAIAPRAPWFFENYR